ncbi:MAG: universal stress protein, partial [Bacteroidota bacterium]
MNVRRILHPTDFSESAGPAFDRGVELARCFRAELHVLHVVERLGIDPIRGAFGARLDRPRFDRELTHAADRRMEDIEKDLKRISVEHRIVRRVGSVPAQEILQYADEAGIDLVVMGTHGRRGFRKMVAGSVAIEVVRKASSPVLTVGRHVRHSSGVFRRVLVPVDFSEHARTAFMYARDMANSLGAELHALHVFEKPAVPSFFETSIDMYYGSLEIMLDTARRELARLNDAKDSADLDAVLEVRVGYAVDEILKRAHEVQADLIVLSTHGMTAIPRFFLGSVSERV